MGAALPKQFLPLGHHQTVLGAALTRFADLPGLQGVVLAVNPDALPDADDEGAEQRAGIPKDLFSDSLPLFWVAGGAERDDSVLAALRFLDQALGIAADAWVLVHDAARPCVRAADIQALLNARGESPDGALLAAPVRDTLKRASGAIPATVVQTVSRAELYHALTPQAFPLGLLLSALTQAIAAGATITDESSAVEWLGFSPRLIIGHADNVKITQPEDLALAQFILQAQLPLD